jgi:hypothetical protein
VDFLHFFLLIIVFLFSDELYHRRLFNRISRLTLVLHGLLTIFNSNGFFFLEAQAEVDILCEFSFHFKKHTSVYK